MRNALVTLRGNIGVDPELNISDKGTKWLRLPVATSSGKNNERTDWHIVKLFGDQAEGAAELSKGQSVTVEGNLEYDRWTDKSGVDHFDAVVYAYSISVNIWKPATAE